MTAPTSNSTSSDFGLLELDREQCLALLSSVPVGRLVHTENALPTIVPLNFVLLDDCVYLRTSEAAGLRAVHGDAVVAFEADAFDAEHHSGWSVVVLGRAGTETNPRVLDRLAELPLHTWATGDRQHVVRIPLELLTGRRVGRGPLPVGTRS